MHPPGECSIVRGEFPLPDSDSRGNPEMGRRFDLVAMPKGLLVGGGNGAQQIAAWWQEAEAAARSGLLPRARRFLRWILACCPEDEEAWLWLARLASSQDARLVYLRHAYSFHPDSVRVQAALRRARCQQLELAVGDLRGGRSVLRCLPDERRDGDGNLPGQGGTHGNGRNGGQRPNPRGAVSSGRSPSFSRQTRAG